MMDLSDGVAADLPRLAEASGCGFEIFEESVPCSRGCSVKQALSDGEDYELLFTIAARDVAALEGAWRKRFPRLPLTRIGVLTPKTASSRARRIENLPHGHDHFLQR